MAIELAVYAMFYLCMLILQASPRNPTSLSLLLTQGKNSKSKSSEGVEDKGDKVIEGSGISS